MKRKSLLFFLLIALLAPLAMNGQNGTLHKSRARSARPELEGNTMMTSSNDKGNRDATYEKVTSAQSDWSGNYLLAASTTSTDVEVFNGTVYNNVYTLNSSTSTYTSVGSFEYLTQSDNVISSITGSDGDGAILTIAPVTASGYTSYYTIQINGGDYLGSTTTGGMITNSSANSTAYYWNISYNTSTSSVYLYSASTNSSTYRICYFVEDDNGTTYGGFCSNQIYYSGSTFDYNDVTLYKETTSGGGDNYIWVETTTITPNEEYLIGFVNNGNVYLAVNYAANESNHYYTSAESATYFGYTAQATFDGNGYVTGVSGYATDLQYCTWKFSTTTGGTIQSGYQSGYYLRTYSSTSYADLYPASGTSNGTDWTYSSGTLYRTISNTNRYAEYYYVSDGPHMRMTSTNPSSANVKLYTKQLVETGYAVNTSTTVTNGSIQYSINGGYDWYDNLSNVPAGETVVISLEPETGYQLTGAPTVTPTSGTAPTVSGSGNLYSFEMPESDVTVNATFNCTAPADPTFSVATGTYTTVQNVSISCATAGATIYYTTDGSTPTDGSTQYNGAITINTTTTLKAIAYIGSCTSGVTTATYTMNLPTYTVTCATGLTGGSISANPTTAVEGTTITITATPESGYFIGTITATDANNNAVAVTVNGNEGTFTMPASNVTVTATFTQGYHVTLNQTPNGTISADQATNLQPGDVVNLTATPDNDCVLLTWYAHKTGDTRTLVSVVNNSFIIMPGYDVTIMAVFVTTEEYEAHVGSGTNANQYLPTYVRANYSMTQQIYTAAELDNKKGAITQIQYYGTSSNSNYTDPTATRSLIIYMQHTSKSTFTSNTDWESMGNPQKVFTGTVTFRHNEWATITLDTPFEYDGTSNINICVLDNTGSQNSTGSGQNRRYITFGSYTTSAYRSIYANGNSTYTNILGYQSLSSTTGTRLQYNSRINITMTLPGSAESLTISPDAITDFSYLEGQGPSEPHKLDVVGVDLQNNITLNAPTNFEISLTGDGTYASSLTIQRETGSKGNRGTTTWDFDDNTFQGWTAVDSDGDTHNWVIASVNGSTYASTATLTDHSGSGDMLLSASYGAGIGALTPDNWLISPQVELGGSFSLWAGSIASSDYAEHFAVYVSYTDTQLSNFMLLDEWTLTRNAWTQYSVNLSAFAGVQGYIAIRHFNCTDMWTLLVDDFELNTDAAISIEYPVTITSETVFVRMKDNLNRGSYNGTLTASAGTGDNVNGSVSLSGVVEAPSYNITLIANPGEGGSLAGAGTYTDGSSVTVSATAQRPYNFINWTENGTVVSTDASYTFTVNADRALVANFGFIKHITSFNNSSEGGYNLIASPIGEVNPTNVGNMITPKDENDKNTYDLFGFDPAESDEWRNYRATNDGFNLFAGKGYLYGNLNDVNLTFIGKAYDGNGQVTLTIADDGDGIDFPDWNLVGNPFAVAAYSSKSYYTMNGTGTAILGVTSNGSVEAMEGIFVKANSNGEVMTFSTTASGKGSNLSLNLTDGGSLIDRAIVSFVEGEQLPKFQLDRNSTKLYIPQDGQDYAIVCSEGMGAMPVNFKAENNGTYSLSFSSENAEFAYLHLIDNMTGRDIDLLQTPSYSFEAKMTDYESRFKLVFATGDNSTSDTFAFFSNGSFVINNDGNATLQVIDITGRIIKSESVNGCTNVNVNAAPGVYTLRLINGTDVKVQKVVVK